MGSCYLVNLTVKNLGEHFPKKNCKKQNQKELRIENLIKRKDEKQHVKHEKVIIIYLTVGIIKIDVV